MIIRTKVNRNYTTINNTILNDARLSWQARGLAAYLLTKPDTWNINRDHLAEQGPDGIRAVRSALKELRTAGYITHERGETADGKFRWDVVLHETPVVVAQNAPSHVMVENAPSPTEKGGVMARNVPARNVPARNVPARKSTLVSTEEVKTEIATTEEQKGARAGSVAPAQSATPPTPAVAIYEEIFERKANSNQRKAITDAVTDCAKWRDVLTTWALRGHSATNVVDQLDVYANGWQRKPHTNGNTPTPEPKTTRRLAQPIFAEE